MSRYKFDEWDDDFITPYKSKKKKTVKKSTHKHDYEKVIGEMTEKGKTHYVIAKKCRVCDKTEITNYFPSVKVEGKPYSRLFPTLEEMKSMYPDLRIIEL